MDFIELVKAPTFWIVSAIGSVLLSVIANLVTPYIGRQVSKFSSTRKSKIENKKQALIAEVIYLASDQNKILNYKVDSAYWILRAVMLLAMGTLLFSVAGYFHIFELIPLAGAAIFISRSTQWLDIAKYKYKIAKLAMERVEEERRIKCRLGKEHILENRNDPLQAELSKWDAENIR